MDEGRRTGDHHAGPPPLSTSCRRYALTLLFLVFTLNFLDRQIINILAEPLKRDLKLADWQLGSLTGLAFAIFYATLALPIARLAERGDRVRIVAISAIVWSAFTTLCGFAHSFLQLFLARIGVGVGEAGCTPASHSLISDYTTRETRASAMALFSMGIPVGSLLGMAFGGLVVDSLGWRAAFLVAGVPGILLGLLTLFTLPEPRRHLGSIKAEAAPKLGEALNELRQNRAYVWMTIAMIQMSFVGFGQLAFHSSFFLRNHTPGLEALAAAVESSLGWQLGPMGLVGSALGIVLGVSGVIGTWLGGALADRAARTDIRGYATIPAAAALVLPFTTLVLYLLPHTLWALVMLGVPMLLHSLYYGPVFASVQSLARPRTRATAAAIFLFFANLVGLGLGPLTVGIVSDIIARGSDIGTGIRWSLIITAFVYLGAAAAFFRASKTMRDDVIS